MVESRRRRALGVAALITSAILILSTVLIFLHYRSFTGALVLEAGESRTVVIPYGTSFRRVTRILTIEGVVSHPWYFRAWARGDRLHAEVKAGTYTLAGPMTLDELGQALRQGGRRDDARVTIPEGFTIFHIADRLESQQIVGRASFLAAARDTALLRERDVPGESFEGYLFPDTYELRRGSSPEAIVRKMHDRFLTKWADILSGRADALLALETSYGFSQHDVVTLASLIERETNYDPERATIARVFLNRIDKGMKLQTDPTCVYSEETYREVPSPRRCKDRLNRYSTYVIKGLPPGPISIPGAESLRAALEPATGSRAKSLLFFVAKRDRKGSHHFTATYKEHKAAIQKYLR